MCGCDVSPAVGNLGLFSLLTNRVVCARVVVLGKGVAMIQQGSVWFWGKAPDIESSMARILREIKESPEFKQGDDFFLGLFACAEMFAEHGNERGFGAVCAAMGERVAIMKGVVYDV